MNACPADLSVEALEERSRKPWRRRMNEPGFIQFHIPLRLTQGLERSRKADFKFQMNDQNTKGKERRIVVYHCEDPEPGEGDMVVSWSEAMTIPPPCAPCILLTSEEILLILLILSIKALVSFNLGSWIGLIILEFEIWNYYPVP